MTNSYLAPYCSRLYWLVLENRRLKSQYNKLETVSRIVNDSEVITAPLLGNHYQTFIDNFDVR
jgi:hypothetical protein